MPYAVGQKGSYGCSGYPVVKEGGEVMGCHMTQEAAARQVQALYASEADKADTGVNPSSTANPKYPNVGVRTPDSMRGGKKVKLRKPRMQGGNGANASGAVSSSGTAISAMYKADTIVEGDYVMGNTKDGVVHGRVEHIMTEGGILGTPGNEYALVSMPPENPAMSVRVYEEEDDEPGTWEPTPYSIGMMYMDAQKLETLDGHSMEEDEDEEDEEEMEYGVEKAEGYTPTSGMKSAAARAIRWKEQGKATGAGTPVGWGRARDIVAGRSMSLSVVRRMYSFFSRHEVDKKGKDFYNTSNPSNGRIMWDAWGGDAGFSWSRAIVNREKDKALFADFGKDYSRHETIMFKGVGVGDMVSWNSSGGTATGKIVRIIRNGKYNVPNSDFTVSGTPEDPAAVIRVYRDGKPTDTLVGHKVKTLRGK